GPVVFEVDLEVLFRVQVELFLPLFVLEADLVEIGGGPALAAAALDSTLRRLVGQRVGWLVSTVVDAAGDDGPIRVSFQEADNHLLAGPREELRPPARPRPDLRDPHPAGALDLTVPVEL